MNLFCMLFGHRLALRYPLALQGLRLRWSDVNRYFDGKPQTRTIMVKCERCGAPSHADW